MTLQTPYEKLSIILMVQVLFKVKISESPLLRKILNDQKENNNTPFFLLLTLKSNLKNIKSEATFLEDYLEYFQKCEYEKRILKHFKEAVEMIINYEK